MSDFEKMPHSCAQISHLGVPKHLHGNFVKTTSFMTMIPILLELLPGKLVKYFVVFYINLTVTRQLLSLILHQGKNKTRFLH